MHYLTGPVRSPYDSIPSPSRVCVESNHSGMGWPIIHSKSVHLTPAPARQSGGNVAYPQIMTGGLRRGQGGGGGASWGMADLRGLGQDPLLQQIAVTGLNPSRAQESYLSHARDRVSAPRKRS